MRRSVACAAAVTALLVAAAAAGSAAEAGHDYRDALAKNLLFFEAQRSGKLPANGSVPWRGDSGLKDGYSQGVDLVGGYYDSGDHVKFGLPMAFAVTMLSWGVIEFEKEIADANQLERALDAIRWGTDYFLKAHTQHNELWVQVGDGDSDHRCWQRAEDMSTPRTAYKVDAETPGSEVAAETAAALAAASVAFKPYNESYSGLLLLHAEQLFSFADTFRGEYDVSVPAVLHYYPSSGYSDELLWAAAWLYHATDDKYYIKYIVDNSVEHGGTGWATTEFSWDNKYAGVQVLLAKALFEDGLDAEAEYSAVLKQYLTKAEFFLCACVQKNNGYNVPTTPGGLLFVNEWNNMQYVSASAFLAAVYSDYLRAADAKLSCPDGEVQPQELLGFARSQVDYILGKNPESTSYLVGYGDTYPQHVHHRGASITSTRLLAAPVGCAQGFEQWFSRPEGNPNVIVGALVGGPDRGDRFADRRGNYEQTEPSMAANGPLVGLLARLDGMSPPPGGRHRPMPETRKSKHTDGDAGAPVEFNQTVTHTWTANGAAYARRRVVVKNVSGSPIRRLRLSFENLTGQLWGLSPASGKSAYELPAWIGELNPGAQFGFVYVQAGPEATVSVASYH